MKRPYRYLAVAVILGACSAMAWPQGCCWSKRSLITFSQPVEVPGRVLPAGTYTFILQDEADTRHIVEIWNADHTRLITTVLAGPAWRNTVSDHTVINFEERGADSPEAINTWYYPGDNLGQLFVYPKAETQVATAAAPETAVVAEAAPPPPAAAPEEPAAQPEEPAAVEPPPAAAAAPAAEAAPETTPDAMTPPATLPATASDNPLLALLGLFGLGLGGWLRWRIRSLGA